MPLAAAVLVGGAATAYAGRKAAGAQEDAANRATAEQRRQFDLSRADQLKQYDQTRKDQEPWMTAGRNSLAQIMFGMGQGGEFMQSFGAGDFQADPGYQFRLSEGQRGLDNSLAARGGLLSGAALKASMRFNQDSASQEYGNAYGRFNNDRGTKFNRLASLAGVGQSATNTVGQAGQNTQNSLSQLGMNYANNVGSNIMGAGNARASAYVNTGNAINNGISNLTGMYVQNQMLKGMGG
jgi:hypothetical protein